MTSQTGAPRRPALLVILDGFGVNPDPTYNAIVRASTPVFDRYFAEYPLTTLEASGRGVGLPPGQMGNSEVGHMTIGCGAIIKQDLVRIDDAIEDGSFYTNPALVGAVERAAAAGRPLHLIGLVSDGGVHSHIDHLNALIRLCHRHDVVAQVHMITDGRDTAPQAALDYLPELEKLLQECGGRIGTVSGRYYAMDRDQRWDRVKLAWDCIVHGGGEQAESARAAIQQSYDAGNNDEFILPTCLAGQQPLQTGDEVVFFNFRNDRVRQISAAFALADFAEFDRGAVSARPGDLPDPLRRASRRTGRVRPGAARNHARQRHQRCRPAAAALRRNRKIRACDLFLQRRPRGALPRRRPQADPSPASRPMICSRK